MKIVPENVSEANATLVSLIEQVKTAPKGEEYAQLMNELSKEIAMNGRFLSVIRFSQAPVVGENGEESIPDGAKVEFALLDDGRGGRYYPAFTSRAELEKWQQMAATNPRTAIMEFDDYAKLILDDHGASGFVINPFSDNLLIQTEAVKRWREKKQYELKGHAESVIDSNAQIEVSDYEALPLALSGALANAAKSCGEVKAIWLRQMEMDGKKAHLLIVEFTGDRQAVYNTLGEAAKEFLTDMDLNIVNAAEPFGKRAIEGAEPLYRA